LGLSEQADETLWTQWRKWTLRFYAGFLITMGLFAVARAVRHHEILAVAAKTIAGVAGAIAVAMGVIGARYWHRYRRARRI
jgi:hypothetical protein